MTANIEEELNKIVEIKSRATQPDLERGCAGYRVRFINRCTNWLIVKSKNGEVFPVVGSRLSTCSKIL